MDIEIAIISIIAMLTGLALRYWMNRRRFNRNNYAGVPTFRSYEHKVLARTAERIVKVLGLLLVLAGGMLLWITYSNKRSAVTHRAEQFNARDK